MSRARRGLPLRAGSGRRAHRPAGSLSRPGRRSGHDCGFTLIELVVAMMILLIVMTATMYSIIDGFKVSSDTQQRVVAAGLVSGYLQQLHSVDLSRGFDSIPQTTATWSKTVNKTDFSFTETNEMVADGAASSECGPGTETLNVSLLVLRSTITARWGNSGSALTESTLLSPSNGQLSATDGGAAIQLTGASGSPYSGATVTVTGQSSGNTASTVTGEDGCAFFPQLTPDSYNFTVSAPGGAAINEMATYNSSTDTPPKTLTVTAGSVATVTVNYDTAGSIDWQYGSGVPGMTMSQLPAAASGMPVSLDSESNGFQNEMHTFLPAAGGTSGVLTSVYPNTYGAVFAGSCTDADPNGALGTNPPQPYYSPSPATAVNVTAGQTTRATVAVYPLYLAVEYSGAFQAGATTPSGSTVSATPGAGTCPGGTGSYLLGDVTGGYSATSVGLGELTVSSLQVDIGGTTRTLSGAPVSFWVTPTGVDTVGANGMPGTSIYQFSSCAAGPSASCSVPVPVQ